MELNLPEKGVTLDAKLALDTLTSDQAALGREKLHALATRALYDDGRLDASATAQRDTLRKNPYYNALQVKYAYAVTCHKARGGSGPRSSSIWVTSPRNPTRPSTSTAGSTPPSPAPPPA